MPFRTPAIAALGTLAALGLGACGNDDRPAGHTAPRVDVRTFIFRPSHLVVAPGTTVTWHNSDQAEHTVTSGGRPDPDTPGKPDGRFSGKLADSGGTFSHTFASAGIYRYFCALHTGSGMTGTVTVR
jgi:plastocyanin